MNKIETILSEARKNTTYKSAYDIETQCEIHIRLYGENSCFLVTDNYHGLYHDDYCSFTYYSNVTGEYFEDSWTTAACCPNYSCYECKRFKDAVNEGLIDINIYNANWNPIKCKLLDFIIKHPKEFTKAWKIYPFVEVYRGRSHKGRKGWMVSTKTINNKGYQTNMEVIFDPENNEFFMVKRGYTKLKDSFVNRIEEIVNSAIDEEMKVTDRLRTLDRSKVVIESLFDDYKSWKNEMDDKCYKWSLNYDYEQEKIKYAPSEKLLQWVRDHFKDITDEEKIYEIAFKINKKNNRW